MSHANSFNTFKEARRFLKKNLKRSINLFDHMICRDGVFQTWYGGRIVHTKRLNLNTFNQGNSFAPAIRKHYGYESKMYIENFMVKLEEKQC